MRRILWVMAVTCLLSGCATGCPNGRVIGTGQAVGVDHMTSGSPNGKVIGPCANDSQCYRDSYSIVWDSWCWNSCRDYPVSYRTKQLEYIVVPDGITTWPGDCGGAK